MDDIKACLYADGDNLAIRKKVKGKGDYLRTKVLVNFSHAQKGKYVR